MKKSLLILTVITTLTMITTSCNSNTKPKLSEAELDRMVDSIMDANLQKIKLEEEKEAIASGVYQWQIDESEDAMTSEKTVIASVLSKNYVNLDFPYKGDTRAKVVVRKKGNNKDVLFQTSDGQITDDYKNPTLLVRFNDEEPVKFSVSKSVSNNSKLRFISNHDKFISKLEKSDSIKIKCTFHSDGSYIFNFDTKGFHL